MAPVKVNSYAINTEKKKHPQNEPFDATLRWHKYDLPGTMKMPSNRDPQNCNVVP